MKKILCTGLIGFCMGMGLAHADVQHWSPPAGCATAGNWNLTEANWKTACDTGTGVNWTDGNDAMFTIGGVTVTVGSAVTVSNVTFGTGSGTATVGGSGVLTFVGAPVIDTTTRIIILSAPYSGAGDVVLTKTGTGTLSLNANGNTFAGKWNVIGGRLSLSNERSLGVVPGTVVTNALILSNGVMRTTALSTVNVNANRGIYLAGAGTWEVSAANTTINLGSRITGPGGLSLNLSGTPAGVVFGLNNTANDFAGALSIGAGATLKLGASEVIPHAANVNCTVGGTLDFNGFNETIRAIAGAGSILMGTNNMNLNRSSGSASFSGVISGSGNITKSGAGTQTLTGANTFTGRLIINGGRIAVPNDGALGAVPGTVETNKITFGGGTLRTTAAFTLNPNRGITIASSSGTWEHNEASEISYNGVIAGAGSFVKAGVDGSVLVLNSANSYAGNTTVSGGTLKLGNVGAVPATSSVAVNSPGIFDLNGFSIQVKDLSGSGTVMSSGAPVSISITNGRVAAGTSLTGNIVGALTLQTSLNLVGSTNRWELAVLTDDTDGVPGTDFDQVVMQSGQLSMADTVLSINFTNASLAPDFANPFWQSPRKWTVVKMAGGSNPTAVGFTSVITNVYYHAGSFSTAVEPDGSLSLSFTPAGPTGAIIVTHPVNRNVIVGGTTNLTVVATGTPPLAYQWYFNDSPIATGTDSSLTITNAQLSDAGNYHVVVDNGLGTATSSNATLSVVVQPAITTQPQPQSVFVGSDATFSVVATGGGLSYQWKFNGTNISGATNSTYTRAAAQTTHAGNYSVLVSNLAGSILSSDAALTVNAAAPLILSVGISSPNVVLSWPANDGSTYRVQYKTNLTDAQWVDLAPDVVASGSSASKTDPIGTTTRFYRVGLLP